MCVDSAGVGRTGTLIALWQLQADVESGDQSVSVREKVIDLRRYREKMVQTMVNEM